MAQMPYFVHASSFGTSTQDGLSSSASATHISRGDAAGEVKTSRAILVVSAGLVFWACVLGLEVRNLLAQSQTNVFCNLFMLGGKYTATDTV